MNRSIVTYKHYIWLLNGYQLQLMFVEGEFVQTAHLNSSEHNRGVSFHFSRVCLSRSCVLSQIPPQHSEATRYNVLMLAEVTLLAVLLFIAWPDKWIEVCACDRISSDVSFSHCRLAHCTQSPKRPVWKPSERPSAAFNGWASERGRQLVYVESSALLCAELW